MTPPDREALPATPVEEPDRGGLRPSGPRRLVLRGAILSIAWILILRTFVGDVVAVLSGSMEPGITGRPVGGDRVVMSRLDLFGDGPGRFDVVFFTYPLNRGMTYVKRVAGLPREQIAILDGDLWRLDDGYAGEVEAGIAEGRARRIRKPDALQRALFEDLPVLKPEETSRFGPPAFDRLFFVAPADRDAWSAAEGDGMRVAPRPDDGRGFRYARLRAAVTDFLPDRDALRGDPSARPGSGGENLVGDVAFEITSAPPRTGETRLRLDDPRTGASCVVAFLRASDGGVEVAWRDAPGPAPTARCDGSADAPRRLKLEVVDGEARASVDDRVVLRRELPRLPPVANAAGGVFFGASGPAEFRRPRVWRDLYWRSDGRTRFLVPDGSYLLLGDQPAESSDGRMWRVVVAEDVRTGEVFEGDADGIRPGLLRGDGRNPKRLPDGSFAFYDRDDREHVVPNERDLRVLGAYPAPYVPRELIKGRAVAVAWPPSRARLTR